MNDVTQCDLSFNKVELDYQALLSVASIAVAGCRENVTDYNIRLADALLAKDVTAIHLCGQWLEREAKNLVVTTDVLAALMGGLAREVVTIVNKPQVAQF